MFLKSIQLKNFRNYDDLHLDLNQKFNIFIGKNAQGKTNILESIYVLAITKSHRTSADENLIKSDTKCLKIHGEAVLERDDDTSLEVSINNKGKKVSINGCAIKKISNYVSNLNVVMFCPDDLEIIKGSPAVRRKFLNIEAGQIFRKYLSILNDYNVLLKTRNEYLKKITIDDYDINYLSILNDQFINKGVEVHNFRQLFIDEINKNIGEIHGLMGGKTDIHVQYESTIAADVVDEANIKNRFREKLEKNLFRDILLAQTNIGPHRDDFSIYLEGHDLKDYGSQGQLRLAVLCMKLAEIGIFKKIKKTEPILLLDDIFSELDNEKKNNIIKYLNFDTQVIITTTDIKNIQKRVLNNANIYLVKNATVKLKGEVKKNGRKQKSTL